MIRAIHIASQDVRTAVSPSPAFRLHPLQFLRLLLVIFSARRHVPATHRWGFEIPCCAGAAIAGTTCDSKTLRTVDSPFCSLATNLIPRIDSWLCSIRSWSDFSIARAE